jgi:hypothetical protein
MISLINYLSHYINLHDHVIEVANMVLGGNRLFSCARSFLHLVY